MKPYHLLLLLFLAGCAAPEQEKFYDTAPDPPEIVAGPMLGYTEHRETLVWLQMADGATPDLRYFSITDSTEREVPFSHINDIPAYGNTSIVHYHLTDLQPSTTYKYYFPGQTDTFQLTTRDLWEWRHYPNDFSFLFGSCNYVNDSLYDRPGKPYGQGTEIFKTMAQQEADWMIWLGDNTYMREVDWSTTTGIDHRYYHTRKDSNLQALLSAMRHLATWDDHDYGANDADISYDLKTGSLEVFENYWGNRRYGLPEAPGVFSKTEWNDVEFYLLDDRYHRSPNNMKDDDPKKQFLGPQQMQWLKNSLLSSSSKFSFRFIIVGNQVLNPVNEFECYRHFKHEWQELMDFIVQNKIEGVIFLSGDRHLTEINQYKPKGGYTLYDVTSSPLTSRPFSNVNEFPEFNNPARLEGTLLTENNFVKATVSGSYKEQDRQVTFTAMDKDGRERWTYTIKQKDLRFE